MSNDSRSDLLVKLLNDRLNTALKVIRLERLLERKKDVEKENLRLKQVIKDLSGDDDYAPRYSKNRVELMIRQAIEKDRQDYKEIFRQNLEAGKKAQKEFWDEYLGRTPKKE